MAATIDRAISAARISRAFLIAPGVASLAFAALGAFQGGPFVRLLIAVALFGAYPAALIFGVPLWLALRHRLRPSVTAAIIGGGFVAVAPWLLLSIGPLPVSASIDGHVTIETGHYTDYGRREHLHYLAGIFAVGTFGGLVFWCVATWRRDTA